MENNLIYIPNDYKPKYPLYKLELLAEKFEHCKLEIIKEFNKILKVFESTRGLLYKTLGTSIIYNSMFYPSLVWW